MSEQTAQDEKPFERPAGVPDTAVWVGGPDGGVFVSLTPDPERKAYVCTVYNDYTGAAEATGYCRPRLERGRTLDPARLKIAGWDGEQLLVDGGDPLPLLSDAELRLQDQDRKG